MRAIRPTYFKGYNTIGQNMYQYIQQESNQWPCQNPPLLEIQQAEDISFQIAHDSIIISLIVKHLSIL